MGQGKAAGSPDYRRIHADDSSFCQLLAIKKRKRDCNALTKPPPEADHPAFLAVLTHPVPSPFSQPPTLLRRAGGVDDTTDAIRAVACIRLFGLVRSFTCLGEHKNFTRVVLKLSKTAIILFHLLLLLGLWLLTRATVCSKSKVLNLSYNRIHGSKTTPTGHHNLKLYSPNDRPH